MKAATGFPARPSRRCPRICKDAAISRRPSASNGALIQIYDPNTLVTLANALAAVANFRKTVVPATRFDPVPRSALGFIPGANAAGAL